MKKKNIHQLFQQSFIIIKAIVQNNKKKYVIASLRPTQNIHNTISKRKKTPCVFMRWAKLLNATRWPVSLTQNSIWNLACRTAEAALPRRAALPRLRSKKNVGAFFFLLPLPQKKMKGAGGEISCKLSTLVEMWKTYYIAIAYVQ